MALGPDIVERLNRARADLRMGVPVLLTSGATAALALAAEALDPARFAALSCDGAADACDHRPSRRDAEGARL